MKNKNKNLPVNITFYINLQILNFASFKQAISKITRISPVTGGQAIWKVCPLVAETCQKGPSPVAGQKSLEKDLKSLFFCYRIGMS